MPGESWGGIWRILWVPETLTRPLTWSPVRARDGQVWTSGCALARKLQHAARANGDSTLPGTAILASIRRWEHGTITPGPRRQRCRPRLPRLAACFRFAWLDRRFRQLSLY